MGYVGAKIDLTTVRNRMARSRTVMRQNRWNTAKAKKFCNDAEAFNWVCRHYRYNYTEWNGNIGYPDQDTFGDYFDNLTIYENYRYMMQLLKEGSDLVYPDSERLWLIKEAKILRNRYK